MKKFAVIGHPIGHTMSPFIHRRLFSLSGIEVDYEVMDVESIEKSFSQLKKLNGFNITIPHKRGIIPFLTEKSCKATAFGSVNTVKIEKGNLIGETTDGIGCRMALISHGCDFGGNTLILGNGGAARAIAFEAVALGGSLSFAVRDINKGEALKKDILSFCPDIKIEVLLFSELEGTNKEYDLLINCTSVGMYPNIGVSPVSENVVRYCKNVFDAVYNPNETQLIKIADSLGCNSIKGMEMLVFQAVEAHKFWYGAEFNKADINCLCIDAVEEMNIIFGE